MAEMANILYETLAGNRIVKAFSMEKAEAGRFRKVTQRIFKLNLRQRMTHSLSSPLMEVLGVLVVAAFLLYARSQIINQRMTAGLFVAFIIALIKLYDPVRRMSGINNSFQQALGASGRILEILALETEKDSGKATLPRFSDRIEFADVCFAYEPGVPVLDGISFTVRRGEVLAIVGSSGAGKTTLVNLLPRFYDVTRGHILIDGRNVQDFQLQSLRKQIAIVTQDVILFNDTIRANIAYGEPAAGEDAIRRAAKAALVDEFVTNFETGIGERGLRLSGGERQRLSIARALLKDAPILILDEATSSLDAQSEALVQKALENLMEGRTTIVIAHRLSTVRRADRIIVLADGRIKESGSHEDLVLRRGLYWKLYNLQFQTWDDRPMEPGARGPSVTSKQDISS
jgi:subfamily B ATP-binding cassette protein MsbA